MSKIRLNKFIALSGITSRRKADDLIIAGKVTINGEISKKLGISINSETDKIAVNNVIIGSLPERVYYMLNKPKDYICANKSLHGDKLVTEFFEEKGLSTVGRLDKNTTGLLIVTNDGKLNNMVSHPSYECEKEYLVKLRQGISDEQINKLKNGLEIEIEQIEKFFAKPNKVEVVKNRAERSVILITINEGKKRQIRLMMKALGFSYIDLKRIRVGAVKLGDLEVGKYRKLTEKEIQSLCSQLS